MTRHLLELVAVILLVADAYMLGYVADHARDLPMRTGETTYRMRRGEIERIARQAAARRELVTS